MSFWNGTRWVEETTESPTAKPSRLADWAATGLMILALGAVAVPLQFAAAASHHATSSGCNVSPSSADAGEIHIINAWGLSTRTAINLWTTVGGVTAGEPLGGTTIGTFAISRSSQIAGVTTYTFSGPTGNNMKIYGSCSVTVT
jgi:hypothetical protein